MAITALGKTSSVNLVSGLGGLGAGGRTSGGGTGMMETGARSTCCVLQKRRSKTHSAKLGCVNVCVCEVYVWGVCGECDCGCVCTCMGVWPVWCV